MILGLQDCQDYLAARSPALTVSGWKTVLRGKSSNRVYRLRKIAYGRRKIAANKPAAAQSLPRPVYLLESERIKAAAALMRAVQKLLRGGTPQSVGAPGDEDNRHLALRCCPPRRRPVVP